MILLFYYITIYYITKEPHGKENLFQPKRRYALANRLLQREQMLPQLIHCGDDVCGVMGFGLLACTEAIQHIGAVNAVFACALDVVQTVADHLDICRVRLSGSLERQPHNGIFGIDASVECCAANFLQIWRKSKALRDANGIVLRLACHQEQPFSSGFERGERVDNAVIGAVFKQADSGITRAVIRYRPMTALSTRSPRSKPLENGCSW